MGHSLLTLSLEYKFHEHWKFVHVVYHQVLVTSSEMVHSRCKKKKKVFEEIKKYSLIDLAMLGE